MTQETSGTEIVDRPPQSHTITREIGIDAGHRVTYHHSKCRNLHGHRYTVQATCKGPLFTSGSQQGMILDFGFLKEEMMNHIDALCDHGLVLWVQDPLLDTILSQPSMDVVQRSDREQPIQLTDVNVGKMYIVPFVPTAENLAKHWYDLLAPRVRERTNGQAKLLLVRVFETPNCSAEYHG